MERHFYSLYLMKFNSLAKRAFLLISLCCLTTPAIAECSKDEYEFQTGNLMSIFTEQKDLSVSYKKAGKKFAKSNSSEDLAKYCQINKRTNQLNRAYLSVDTALEKSCPFNYNSNQSQWEKIEITTSNMGLYFKNPLTLVQNVDFKLRKVVDSLCQFTLVIKDTIRSLNNLKVVSNPNLLQTLPEGLKQEHMGSYQLLVEGIQES